MKATKFSVYKSSAADEKRSKAKRETDELNYENNQLFNACFTFSQDEMIPIIQKFTEKYNKPMELIDGNLVRLANKDKPIFCAHLDIVDNNFNTPIKFKGNTVYRPNNILGGDDRCGVYAILHNINKIDNFIFTVDEEIGAVGSNALMKNEDFVAEISNFPCCIVLDRKGNSDIISVENDYCDFDLVDEIKNILPKYDIGIGTFSDADSFRSAIPCVNLSVGYYNAHSTQEWIYLPDLTYIAKMLPKLNEIRGEFSIADDYFTYDEFGYLDYYGDNRETATKCVFCGSGYDITTYHGKGICRDCLTELFYQEEFV